MELTSDYPFWSIRNGLPASYPALERDLECDVAVVGGGITGALVGFRLAEAGLNTVLVDKRDIGTGSTCGSTALLQYEVDVPLRQLARRLGRRRAVRSYQLCGEAVSQLGKLVRRLGLRCEYSPRPSLFLAKATSDIAGFKEEARQRREAGFDVEFWSESELRQRFPFSRPAALFSELGAEVDPHLLTHGLLRAATGHGLKVFDRTEVRQILPRRGRVDLRLRSGVVIRARRAVMAAGYESAVWLTGRVARMRSTYALVSEPVETLRGWHRRSLIWECGLPYLYLRTTRDKRIMLGGEDTGVVQSGRRDAQIARKTAILVRSFNGLFPEIKLDVAYSWAGTFSETKDGLAYIDVHPRLPNVYFALGYGGNGIPYGMIAANLIRDACLGRQNRDAALFRFDR